MNASYIPYTACTVKQPPEDKYLAYLKHVEDLIRIKFGEVHFVGFIIQFFTTQVNIISNNRMFTLYSVTQII